MLHRFAPFSLELRPLITVLIARFPLSSVSTLILSPFHSNHYFVCKGSQRGVTPFLAVPPPISRTPVGVLFLGHPKMLVFPFGFPKVLVFCWVFLANPKDRAPSLPKTRRGRVCTLEARGGAAAGEAARGAAGGAGGWGF